MSTTALVLAGLSFGLSFALAAIKVWETFVSKSKFSVDFQWFDDVSDIELRLAFTVANVGHRPDSVRTVRVRAEDGEIALPVALNQALPVLLQPGELSRQFSEHVRTDVAWDPHTSMFVGKATLELINSVGRVESFSIPNPYDADVLGPEEPPSHEPWPPETGLPGEGKPN